MKQEPRDLFSDVLEHLREAVFDLERMRRGANDLGFEFEEIHVRLFHLRAAIENVVEARDRLRMAMGSGDDDEH